MMIIYREIRNEDFQAVWQRAEQFRRVLDNAPDGTRARITTDPKRLRYTRVFELALRRALGKPLTGRMVEADWSVIESASKVIELFEEDWGDESGSLGTILEYAAELGRIYEEMRGRIPVNFPVYAAAG